MTEPVTGYKIGKVSKLTGISTDKLRIWERRYSTVSPVRSDSGGRLYTNSDISRLKLIKKLIDSGDSIGNIASLSLEELQSRMSQETQSTIEHKHDEPIRIVIIGGLLPATFSYPSKKDDDFEIVASYSHNDLIDSKTDDVDVDLLVFDKSPLQQEHIPQILDLIDRFNAKHAVVVYRFATRDTLNRLPKSKCSTLRAPLDINEIFDHCRSIFVRSNAAMSLFNNSYTNDNSVAPLRRYDDETLGKIAEMSPVVKCECPHHLAELVFALTSFEKYSSECESQSLEDSELHAYLGNATAKARHIIEDALDKVIEVENIQL